MKSWKGWMEHDKFVDTTKEDGNRPVLVIDASDFPEGYPEIDSEWLDGDRRVTVISQPLLDTLGIWRTAIQWAHSTGLRHTSDLKPIPKTAKGEIVGTLEVGEDLVVTHVSGDLCNMKPDTYDIIKRGDT